MDINVLRGLLTALMLFSFLGLVFWAYSGKRKSDFQEAAALALENDHETDKQP